MYADKKTMSAADAIVICAMISITFLLLHLLTVLGNDDLCFLLLIFNELKHIEFLHHL
jgi:hypothetical protein